MAWKEFNYSNEGLDNQLEQIAQKKAQLEQLRPIPPAVVQSIRDSLSIEWTYNSNSIEGNTMTLRETQMIIEEGFTVKGKSLREHFEVVNHKDAIEYIEQLAKNDCVLTIDHLLKTHYLVLQRIEHDYAGRFRTSGVRIVSANFVSPNALKVDTFIRELIDWVNHSTLHSIIKATIFHHRFVWIHPFFDGNGRTVRLLFNLLLMKEGYPPAIILRNDRKKYYDALNAANNEDYSKLLLLVLQAVERGLDIYLSSLTNTYDEYKSISSLVKEDGVPYGEEYISLLARKGKIDAFKEGKNWLTSQQAITDYLEGRKRKRVLRNKA
jgi:Fic family protein